MAKTFALLMIGFIIGALTMMLFVANQIAEGRLDIASDVATAIREGRS